MPEWLKMALTIIGSVMASSGFWAYIMRKTDNKDAMREMLIGLGHDRIMSLGTSYLERTGPDGKPWITQAEYENLHDYLYLPYEKLGGNGSAKRVMKEVDKIPIRNHNA